MKTMIVAATTTALLIGGSVVAPPANGASATCKVTSLAVVDTQLTEKYYMYGYDVGTNVTLAGNRTVRYSLSCKGYNKHGKKRRAWPTIHRVESASGWGFEDTYDAAYRAAQEDVFSTDYVRYELMYVTINWRTGKVR